MGENKQKRRFRLTVGRLSAFVIGVVVIVYMAFSVRLFYNFIKLMITDPDAAKQQGTAAEALDETYVDEEE